MNDYIEDREWEAIWYDIDSRISMVNPPSGDDPSMARLYAQKHSGIHQRIPNGLYTLMPLPKTCVVDPEKHHTKIEKIFLEAAAQGLEYLAHGTSFTLSNPSTFPSKHCLLPGSQCRLVGA